MTHHDRLEAIEDCILLHGSWYGHLERCEIATLGLRGYRYDVVARVGNDWWTVTIRWGIK
jgi:hypothetical protein